MLEDDDLPYLMFSPKGEIYLRSTLWENRYDYHQAKTKREKLRAVYYAIKWAFRKI